MKANRVIVFLHNDYQVDYAEKSNLLAKATCIIATTPEASWSCQQKNIKCRTVDSYVCKDELYQFKRVQFSKNMDWLNFIDKFLHTEISELGQTNFKPAHFYTMGLFGLLDELFIGIYLLSKIFEEEKPGIVYHQTPPIAYSDAWMRVMPRVLFYQLCIEDFVGLFGSVAYPIFEQEAVSSGHFKKKFTKRQLRDKLLSLNVNSLREFKYDPIRVLYRILGKLISQDLKCELKLLKQYKGEYIHSLWRSINSKQREKLMLLGGSFELAPLMIELRKKGCKVKIFDDPVKKFVTSPEELRKRIEILDDLWHKISSYPEFLSLFQLSQNKISYHALDIAQRWWITVLPRLWLAYSNACIYFQKANYKAIVTWALGEDLGCSIIAAGQNYNIPSFCYQHGGSSRGHWDINTIQEIFNVDYYFTYGEGNKLLFETASSKLIQYGTPCKVLPVGSARLDQIRTFGLRSVQSVKRLRQRIMNQHHSPLVLYIPTVYEHPGVRLYDGRIHGVEYFKFQQEILKIFMKFKQYEYIYKGFPGTLDSVVENPIQKFINCYCAQNVHYFSNILAHELMWAADLLIIDHVQTAINELLLTNKKIIVLDYGKTDWSITCPEGFQLLSKRAMVARETNEFLAIIEEVLFEGDFSPVNNPNKDFLKAFGTLDDGLSASRASDYIIEYSNKTKIYE